MRSDTPDYEITSTVRGHEIAMSIDMDSLPDLFDVLSGLYTDPEMAVLRELSTNARDSHIEAGVTRPIEVTLPTSLDPHLIIQDFGVGMSREDIETTYSKYGASTKRDSDDFNGTLGLGSKSPLTYTPQFTFTGVKDGVRTTVSVGKSDTGPVMKVIGENPTDEGNGVRITIPAKHHNEFAQKAEQLFRFWDPKTVLVSGYEPTPITGLRVTDEIMVTEATDGQSYVVMAGVPYPARFDHSLLAGWGIVAYVPTGNVSIVPSREGLKPTTKTKEAIASILAEYEREVPNAVQAQIEDAAHAREAFQMLAAWRKALGSRTMDKTRFKFKGREIPTVFEPKGEKITVSERDSTKLSACSRFPSVTIGTIVNSLCVYGYDIDGFTPSHKKKLIKHCEDNGIEGVRHFVLCNKKLPTHWLERNRVVSWDTIRSIKLPRTYTARDSDRIAGSYDVYEQDDLVEGMVAEDIDATNPIYYVNKTDGNYNAGIVAHLLKEYKRNSFSVVVLTNNRIEKFTRLFPKAEPVERELDRIYKRVASKITDDERRATVVQGNYSYRHLFRYLDADKLDDPAFGELKRLLDMDLKRSNMHKLTQFNRIGYWGRAKSRVNTSDASVQDPFDPYHLVSASDFSYYGKTADELSHIYLYLNAAYAAAQAEAKEQ